MSLAPYYRTYTLAWEDDPDERQRLRKILRIGLIVFVVFGILIPLLPTPKVVPNEESIPPRLAQ